MVPEPRYEDDHTRRLGEELAAARRRFKELSIAGRNVDDVREQILGLRRTMRDGGRLQPGDQLGEGRFQLLEIAGRGGFATVWKAWDEERHALVAVKVLHGLHAEDRTRRERFFRGARKMAELHHPGIVRVIEAELAKSGKHFFVMDYVGGGDLRRAVLGGELPREKVLPVILAVGEALAFAHEKGVVHRDVKPANILLDGDRPKLIDFDLVRAFDTTGGTQTQGLLGTVLYSAPEMLGDAKSASAAADIYSLAMTAVFAFHGKDLPPDVWRRPEVFLEQLPCPPALREALGRGISWEPERRPGSVAEFCEELRRAAAAQAVGMAKLLGIERVVPRRSRRAEPAPGEERLHALDGTVLLYVPGGEYTLGAADLTDEERPIHRIVLRPFWIAKYPVTNEQYGRFLVANPRHAKPAYWADKWFNQPHQPVVGVSWEEAQAYCRWSRLRLPSEAQWEAAARGTDGRRYPWGNAAPTLEHANFGGREGGTTGVGSYPQGAGAFGALDQAGNVWEWCEDVWDAAAYRRRDGQRDPVSATGDPPLEPGIGPGQVHWLSLPVAAEPQALILGFVALYLRGVPGGGAPLVKPHAVLSTRCRLTLATRGQ
jgi:formylglycine-generating enzyme required for sulfatase activity